MVRTTTMLIRIILPALLYGAVWAGGSYSLEDWVLGVNEPVIASGMRGDASTGNYISVPVGTHPFYYEVADEGEGSVTMWVHDPGKCLANPNPGYPNLGPRWGLMNPSYHAFTVGIARASYVAGCQGYSPWSSVAPYNYYWFRDGVRASQGAPFTPGWYKWTVTGTWDDISFTLHGTYYEVSDGTPHDDLVFGDVTKIYNATTSGGTWEAVFGDGWKSIYCVGDGSAGIEPIGLQLVEGTGIFAGITPDAPVLTVLSGAVYAVGANDSLQPVAGATVTLLNGGTDVSSVTTGGSGAFSFTDLAQEDGYGLAVSCLGYHLYTDTFTVSGTAMTRNVTLTALPDTVVYTSFTADTTGDSVLLSWTTSLEHNNTGWFVYRSQDSTAGYERLGNGNVPGKGAGYDTVGGTYAFTGTVDTSGTFYYYLEQMSTDLSLTYSGTLSVVVTVPADTGSSSVSTVPPAGLPFPFTVRYDAGAHAVRVRAGLTDALEMRIRILNINGRSTADLHDGRHTAGTCALDLPFDAPAGVYLLDVAAGPYRMTYKLLVAP